MSSVIIRPLTEEELTPLLFGDFNRYQKVTRCYRKVDEDWVLKDIPFIENWAGKSMSISPSA